jgi:hypothetical protein
VTLAAQSSSRAAICETADAGEERASLSVLRSGAVDRRIESARTFPSRLAKVFAAIERARAEILRAQEEAASIVVDVQDDYDQAERIAEPRGRSKTCGRARARVRRSVTFGVSSRRGTVARPTLRTSIRGGVTPSSDG